MTKAELVRALEAVPDDHVVVLAVGWAKDTATSDEGEAVDVRVEDGTVTLRGWMSGCGTELEFEA